MISDPEEDTEFRLHNRGRSGHGSQSEITKKQVAHKHIQLNQMVNFISAKSSKALPATSNEPGCRKGNKPKVPEVKSGKIVNTATKKSSAVMTQLPNNSKLQGFKWRNILCVYDSLWTIFLLVYKQDSTL